MDANVNNEIEAEFSIAQPELDAEFELSESANFDAIFELYASGTTWGTILGDINNQNDLIAALDLKADKTTVAGQIETVTDLINLTSETLDNKIDGVQSSLAGDISVLTQTVESYNTSTNGRIDTLSQTVSANDTAINNKVDGINTTLTNSINNLSDTVTDNYNALDARITANTGNIATNAGNITTINSKIPNQASSSNQLADKDFVNSSIATNTANFIGTFNSVAELEAYTGTLTNNDYAFVATTDAVGNTLYDRYKWNGSEWLFEYELNNSSFTAQQWASINSGATSTNIGQITINANNIADLQTNKQDVLTAGANIQINNNVISATDTTYTAGTGISIVDGVISNTQTSATWGNITGTLSNQIDLQDALDAKQSTISDLSTIRNNAALGATALQPNDDITKLVNDAGYITATALAGYATQTWVQNQNYLTSISSSDIIDALGYTPYNASNPAGFITYADLPTNYVTTDTVQNITAEKTFVGNKLLKFKGVNASSKLGFTAYDSGNHEVGYLEGAGSGNSAHTFRLGIYDTTNTNYDNKLGFEYYKAKGSDGVLHRYNLLAPPLYPSTTAQDLYIPISITDGTNTVTADNQGTVNISSLLPDVSGFATQTWVQNQNYLTSSALTGYATEQWVTNQNYVNSTTLTNTLANYVLSADLASVATSGDYNDLINKPTIPSAVTESTVSDWGFTKNIGTVTSVNGEQPDSAGNVTLTIPDSATWGNITGTLSNQTDLQTELNKKLENTATGNNSLTIGGNPASRVYAINIGHTSSASGNGAVALGCNAKASAMEAIAIGTGATVTTSANNAIQLGAGTNATVNTFSVGFSYGLNYQLLDGTTGLIPYTRINAITDSNGGNALKYWTGTKAQYDAIATKDTTTLYNITDDTDVTLALLELLFPVGAVYFGTMSTCPLQTLGVGTWQALPPDKVIQIAGTRGSVGDTLNESLPNIKGNTAHTYLYDQNNHGNGAFYWNTGGGGVVGGTSPGTGSGVGSFDASRSSSTYQDNAPVQQDAYLLNGWRRIA